MATEPKVRTKPAGYNNNEALGKGQDERKIILRISQSKDGRVDTNYPAWVRHMIDNVMTKYGDKFVDAVKSMRRINIQSARAVAEQFPE